MGIDNDIDGSDQYSRMLYKEMAQGYKIEPIEKQLISLRNDQTENIQTEVFRPITINPQAERILVGMD